MRTFRNDSLVPAKSRSPLPTAPLRANFRFADHPPGVCRAQAELYRVERADVAGILFRDARDFQTAQAINHSLRCLYWLAAKNRSSSRRAKVLAYVSGLLLRTLPVMAEERRAGIT